MYVVPPLNNLSTYFTIFSTRTVFIMKFVLYDFFQEGTVEIGPTDLIDLDESSSEFTTRDFCNENWVNNREVLVNWPNSRKGKSKSGKYVAHLMYFSDDRRDAHLLEMRDSLLDEDAPTCIAIEGSTVTKQKRTGTEGGKKRPLKRPQRFISESDTDSDDTAATTSTTSALKKKSKKTAVKEDLVDQLIKRKEAARRESTNLEAVANSNDLKDELKKAQEEVKALTTAMTLVKELPDLLSSLKDLLTQAKTSLKMQPPSTPCSSPSRSVTEKDIPSVKYSSLCNSPLNKNAPKMLQDMMCKSFTRNEMATHSLTGAASNANNGLDAKPQIDKVKMEEIFAMVQKRFPEVPLKFLKEAARNKLSNERKLQKRASNTVSKI